MALTVRSLASGAKLPGVNPDVLRLYSMRFCPFAQRTRIVLLYKNIDHEIVNCNLKYKAPWLLARNPRGLVPVVEYKNSVIYESTICGDFLDDLVETNKLTSRCPFKKAKDTLLMDLFDQIPRQFYRIGNPDPQKKALAKELIGSTLDKLESALVDKTYFGGDAPCMLDFHVFPWFERMPAIERLNGYNILPAHRYPRLVRWYGTIAELPAVKETMLPTEWQMEFMASLFMKSPNYDIGLNDVNLAKL